MEVETRQGVCNNSPAESTSPENGWRSSETPKPGHRRRCDAPMSRRARGLHRRRGREPRLEQPLVQILVLVAIIQMKTLKAEVEKGFT